MERLAGYRRLALMASPDPKAAPLSQRELLAILDPDVERAEGKYLELWQKLERFFEWKQVSDPADLVQETIVRAIHNLQAGKTITTDDPTRYFFGIAKNLIKEGWKPRRHEQLEEHEFSSEAVTFLGLDHAEQNIYLKECLHELSQEDFDLLSAYIEGATKEWGSSRGLQHGAVRLRVYRIRKRIEERVKARISRATKKM